MNPSLNEGLPAFLAARPGIESGLMMAQVTAAALGGRDSSAGDAGVDWVDPDERKPGGLCEHGDDVGAEAGTVGGVGGDGGGD